MLLSSQKKIKAFFLDPNKKNKRDHCHCTELWIVSSPSVHWLGCSCCFCLCFGFFCCTGPVGPLSPRRLPPLTTNTAHLHWLLASGKLCNGMFCFLLAEAKSILQSRRACYIGAAVSSCTVLNKLTLHTDASDTDTVYSDGPCFTANPQLKWIGVGLWVFAARLDEGFPQQSASDTLRLILIPYMFLLCMLGSFPCDLHFFCTLHYILQFYNMFCCVYWSGKEFPTGVGAWSSPNPGFKPWGSGTLCSNPRFWNSMFELWVRDSMFEHRFQTPD